MMMEFIDAHMHLPVLEQEPDRELQRALAGVKTARAQGCVLILNTPQEQAAFEQVWEVLRPNLPQLYVSNILDCRENQPLGFFYKLKAWGIEAQVKLHPRFTDIREEDFAAISCLLGRLGCGVVTVDCFPYGHHLQNHVGIELGIYLAQRYPKITFVLAHAGGHELIRCMLQTRTLKNIYYDYSLTCCYLFGTSVQTDMIHFLQYNHSRILFGSDFPDFSPSQAFANMKEMFDLAQLSQQARQNVLYENAKMLYEHRKGDAI